MLVKDEMATYNYFCEFYNFNYVRVPEPTSGYHERWISYLFAIQSRLRWH